MKALSRFLASTKNSPFRFLLGVGSLSLLWGLRMPGGDIPFLLTGTALLLFGLIFVAARIVTRLILRFRKQPETPPVLAGWCTWLLGAFVILVIGLLATFGVPFRMAFAVSRPQLEQLVGAYKKGQSPEVNAWAGLFPIASAHPIKGGFQFTFRKAEFPWGERGVYFSGSGEQIEISHSYDQKRIESKWFSWHYGGW